MEIRANSNIYISTDIHSLFQKKNKPTTFSQCRTWTAFIDNVANSFLSYLRWKWNPVDQNPFCDALSRWGIWVKTTVGHTEQRHMGVCVLVNTGPGSQLRPYGSLIRMSMAPSQLSASSWNHISNITALWQGKGWKEPTASYFFA